MSIRIPSLPNATALDKTNDYLVIDDGTTTQSISGDLLAEYTRLLPYGEVDGTSTSTAFTATIPGITTLQTGTVIYLYNGIVSSASGCTLNVNGLGAYPLYSNKTSSVISTLFEKEQRIIFIFDENVVAGGAWVHYNGYYTTDSDTKAYRIQNYAASFLMKEQLTRYKIILSIDETYGVATTQVSNSTGNTKALTTREFNPFLPIYYYSTTTSVNAESAPGASYIYTRYNNVSFRYSFNEGTTLTTNKLVFLIIEMQSNGMAKLLSGYHPITQTLPTTNDGYHYLLLGTATNDGMLNLYENHPIFYHDGTALKRL